MTTSGLLKREISRQVLRFALVGTESTVLNYLLFLIMLVLFDLNYLLSAATGFIAVVLFGFYFNKIYTFESKRKAQVSLPLYFGVYALSLVINLALLFVLVESFGMNKVASNLILFPFIIILNFLGSKIIAFRNKKW